MKIKLQYLKGSKEKNAWMGDGRMWNVIEPKLPEYGTGLGRVPTLMLPSLIKLGLVPAGKNQEAI